MIVSKTPLRVSLLGGGSDIPQFYNKHPGMVISTSINKYIQIAANFCQTDHCRVVYSEMEVVNHINGLKHNRVREALRHFGISSNIEICSFSDVPTKGTGLGSSSTFTVGLLNSLYNLKVLSYNKRDLAELACDIEIEKCQEPIGKQDQYAATYGGFNVIRFDSSGVEVSPINVASNVLFELNENLMCYSTGINRKTSDILSEQVENLDKNSYIGYTKEMVDIAEAGLRYLQKNKIDDFGSLLHDTWQMKKKLASAITNEHIDIMYDTAITAGALGGKILGAGGGGYLLLYVSKKQRRNVSHAMRDYRQFHFKFTDTGSQATTI